MAPFRTLLIANRGEIAVRIARTARALGYRTVAVYSDADADAPHVRAADTAVRIGPAEVGASYLSPDRLLEAAAATGADAVHPGYGFLSENADFVDACQDAGLVFVGPPAEAVRLMGNKRAAKSRLVEAGVPVVPGFHGEGADDAALAAAARELGYPLMVKAAAGGGGRGMRRVTDSAALPAALRTAREEALAAFGSGELLLETLLDAARHVEVQVFADAHGNVLHLGERDCSVQRRHQKLIEEAPAPGMTPALRERMGTAAVAAARAIGYQGAGTVEFLLDADGAFYFLEMNTRLQVEHPVTEAVTGEDLVAWQLRVAAGEPLPLRQEDVRLQGHAMEARLYAEDAYAGFLPASGPVLGWEAPTGEGVRVDHAVAPGMAVGTHYDGLLAKVIAHGATREEARRRLLHALERTVLLGVQSNRSFLAAVLGHEDFVAGGVGTGWLEGRVDLGAARPEPPAWLWLVAVAWLYEGEGHPAARWALPAPPSRLRVQADEGERTYHVRSLGGSQYAVEFLDSEADGRDASSRAPVTVQLEAPVAGGLAASARVVHVGAVRHQVHAGVAADGLWLSGDGYAGCFREPARGTAKGRETSPGDIVAPLSGRVLSVAVEAGQSVRRGQSLLVLEAMKLQHELTAAVDGTVARIETRTGSQVVPGQLLVEIQPAEPPAESSD